MRPERTDAEHRDRVRLQHMMDAARQAMSFIVGRSRDDLGQDDMLARALMHAIQEIGEAASKVSSATRQRAPTLPWREIIGMRHFLVHVYWGVDLDRLWRTATEDLPVLVRELERATRHWPLRGAGGPL